MHGASLERATETSVLLIALRQLLHDLLYVIVEDHPNTRSDPHWNPFQHHWHRIAHESAGPDRRDGSVSLDGVTAFGLFPPAAAPTSWVFHLQALRAIGLSSRQLGSHGRCDRFDGITFGVPVATRCAVSWTSAPRLTTCAKGWDPGPSIYRSVYDLVTRTKAGPIWLTEQGKDAQSAPGSSRRYSASAAFALSSMSEYGNDP